MPFPRVAAVRQHFPDRKLQDIQGEVRCEFASAGLGAGLRPGARVAIGVGSRGIANLDTIVRTVVDCWKSAGAKPFLFPAMGTHGGATPEGQARVLARFGITAEAMGCPVMSSLDVVPLATTPEGIETFLDRQAYESDGIMFVARVKWHTDFEGKLESGLFKMMSIGLGKVVGARRYHLHAFQMGMESVIRSVGRHVLRSGKILGGLAVIEDEQHNTAKISAVRAAEMEKREEELLALAKSWMARIPVPALDILIVDEIGKDISGTGMDTKVVNRNPRAAYNPWPNTTKIERIFARSMSDLGYGNAVGVGMADVVTDRLVDRIDWPSTAVNSFTSGALAAVRIPVHFPTDRECLENLVRTVGRLPQERVTISRIRNTLDLGLLLLSEDLLPEVSRNSTVEILESPHAMEFDKEGNLLPF